MLALLIVLAYINVVNAPFIWDDRGLIVGNEFIRSFSYYKEWFTENSLKGAGIEASNLYRPLQLFFHTIIYSLFELKETPYHLLNILLHIINSCLVFSLFKELKLSHVLSICATLVFAVHPVHTELVSYISGLPDLLAVFFTLSGLLSFIQRKYLYTLTFLILGFCSKELGVALFALAGLITVYNWSEYTPQIKSEKIKWLIIYACITLAYITLRLTVLNFTGSLSLNFSEGIYTSHLSVRLITFISILPEYVKLILAPFNLFFEKPFEIYTTLFTTKGLFGVLVLLLGSTLSYLSLKKKKIFFFGFAWFFISIAPVSGVIPSNAIYTEHWLYLPLIGVFIMLISGLMHIQSKKSQAYILIPTIIIILLFTTVTINRNKDWNKPVQFFKNEITHNPTSPRLYNQLGRILLEEGDYQSAKEYLMKGIQIDTKNSIPLLRYRLGETYLRLEDTHAGALQYFEILKINPNYIPAHNMLEKIFRQSGYNSHANTFQEFIQKIQNGGTVNYAEIEPLHISK